MNAYFARLAQRSDVAPVRNVPRAPQPPAQSNAQGNDNYESQIEVLVTPTAASTTATETSGERNLPHIQPSTTPQHAAPMTQPAPNFASTSVAASPVSDDEMLRDHFTDTATEWQSPASAVQLTAASHVIAPTATPDAASLPPATPARTTRTAPATQPSSGTSKSTLRNTSESTYPQTEPAIAAHPDSATSFSSAVTKPRQPDAPATRFIEQDDIAETTYAHTHHAATATHARPLPRSTQIPQVATAAPAQSVPQIHIGRIELNVRQPAPPPPAPVQETAPRRTSSFNPHRHYLRGL